VTSTRLEEFLTRLREEFPGFVVIAVPFKDPDEEGIEHFIHLLNVPDCDLDSTAWRGLEMAFEFFGGTTLPFHLTTIDCATSRTRFAKEIEESRWLHTPSIIRRRASGCVRGRVTVGEWRGMEARAPRPAAVDDAPARSEAYRPASRAVRSTSSSTVFPFPDHHSLAS
jgi:hypothetical protein